MSDHAIDANEEPAEATIGGFHVWLGAIAVAVVAMWTTQGYAADRDPAKIASAILQPIAVAGTSALAASPEDLAKRGYVEQEYYVSGTAKRYTFPDAMSNATVADGDYPTRPE